MDVTTDVAVSLDELTFELNGDECFQEKVSNEPADHSSEGYNQNHQHDEEILITDQKVIDEAEGFITKEFNEAETSARQAENGFSHGSIPQGDKVLVQPQDFEDFEVDVPPLSLFTSARDNASDDSDFEFEVPDRPPVQAQQETTVNNSDKINTEDLSSKTSISNKYIVNESDTEITLKSLDSSLQPQILTPRDKIPANITLLSQSENTTNSIHDSTKDKLVVGETKEPNLPTTNISDLSTKQPSSVVSNEQEESYDKSGIKVVLQGDKNEVQLQLSGETEKPNVSHPQTETHNVDTDDSQKPSIVTTAEDWEGIQTVEPGIAKPGGKSTDGAAVVGSKPLATFADSWAHFEGEDYSSVQSQIKTHIERRGFSAFTHFLFGPPKLNKDLIPQRELVFCIAATQLDNEKQSHIRVLQTVYRCLTGSKFDCQRFGGHWEEIGFQGRDPATDLRGAGMLALLHLLSFLRDPTTKDLARDVYKLSLHPTQNFPFCVMGINISRICLQVLREDVFNKECNRRKDVVSTINAVYAALYLKLYQVWRKGKTIADSGFVLQDVENYCRKQAKNIFRDLEAYEKTKKLQGPFGEVPDAEPAFFSVCKEENCDDKSAAELY